MKNFYSFEDFSELNIDVSQLSSNASIEFKKFLANLPQTEGKKLKIIEKYSFIKMYSIVLKTDLNLPAGEEQPLEFFNINVDTPEDNYNNGNGKLVKMIESVYDMNYYDYKNLSSFFYNTLNSLNHLKISTAWIMSYKNKATVSPHTHNDSLLFAHILLDDIQEGFFEINVQNEIKTLSKRGEYFIFPGKLEHSARFNGNSCSFISFSIAHDN